MGVIKKVLPLALIVILSYFTIQPLFIDGFFPMHDDTQPTRVFVMAEALKDGQWPVRWVDGLGYGYGYPLFNFYAPLPYHIGAIGVIGAMGIMDATKMMFAFGVMLAALTMFILGKKLWGVAGGLVSAIFYVYAPYHAVQVYVRGAVGEYWAYAFLPVVGWGLWEIWQKKYLKGITIGALGFAGIILSHNITGLITGLFLGMALILTTISILVTKAKIQKCAIAHFCVILLGLGLASWFWLPAVIEAPLTRVHELAEGTNDYREHFVFADQLWDSPWGYAGSAPGRADGMSFKIGKVHIIVALIGLVGMMMKYMGNKGDRGNNGIKAHMKVLLVLFTGFMVSVFMMLPISQWVWELVPPLSYAQYPWRFLVFGLFFLSLLTGSVVAILTSEANIKDATSAFAKHKLQIRTFIERHILKKRENRFERFYRYGAMSVIITVAILVNVKYFTPQYINDKTVADYVSEQNISWTISKISDEYLSREFSIPKDQVKVAPGNLAYDDAIIVESSEYKSHFWKLNISARRAAEIVFYQAYYPGWEAIVDTTRVPIKVADGIMSIIIPEGEHVVTLQFVNTRVRTVGNLISLGSGVVLLYMLLKLKNSSAV